VCERWESYEISRNNRKISTTHQVGKYVRNSVADERTHENVSREGSEGNKMYVGVAVVKVTQHLCQKQLQSSSLSCSFIIPHTHTHTYTHHIHTHTYAIVSAGKSFHFFPFYLTGLPEKLVEQIFMKILLLLLQFSSVVSPPLSLTLLAFSVALRKQSQKSRSTLFLVCCLLPASLACPSPSTTFLLPWLLAITPLQWLRTGFCLCLSSA